MSTQVIDDYQPTTESLDKHQVPQWFNDAKLGFFIHWGAFSVPAWAPVGNYAEWYGREMNNVGSPTYNHHKEVYGENYPYDQFIEDWKPTKFDPNQWIKLFEKGGAKYFVMVSKHHDGVALWDTATSDRNTVALGPHRDFVKELFDAAKKSPLKTGVYYSMPEWYHPNYSLGSGFPGGPPHNPYTGEEVPYTGYKPINDYVMDHQYPQMVELVQKFDPDVIWCDIGGPNNSDQFMAYYYNQAKNRPVPKDVVVDNRCGNSHYDFTTPEYSVEPNINPSKWEATRGIGYSFGYNQQEGVNDYLSADQLIDSFTDIVSKNGNLLLNIGPKADGSIPDIQAQRIRALGQWLKINGEGIYGTTYWNHAEDEASNVPVRYTVKGGALYATALQWPGKELVLSGDLPLSDTSQIALLGSDGQPLQWRRDGDKVRVTMPAAGSDATESKNAFMFKVTTPGVSQLVRSDITLPETARLGEPITAKVTVTNPASTPISGVGVGLNLPAGWTAQPEGATADLPAGGSKTIEFNVTQPTTIQADVYQISAKVTNGAFVYDTIPRPVLIGFENAALGTPATQKSVGWGGLPGRAVDGRTDGAFFNGSVTHTAEPESEAWWQTDLGASKPIKQISIWNRTDCCSQRLSDYYVMVSDTPFTSDSLTATLAQPGVHAYHQTAMAKSPERITPDISGRYIRVQLASKTDPLSLAEVQVFTPTSDVVGAMTAVDLTNAFNNDGIATASAPGDGDFDGSGNSYPAEELPAAGTVTFGAVPFSFPSGANGAKNNVVANGQTIDLPQDKYRRIHVLASSGWGPVSGTVTATYTDGTTSEVKLEVGDWVSGSGSAELKSAYRYGPTGRSPEGVGIYRYTYVIDPGRTLRSLTLPQPGQPSSLHLFSLTMEK
jgi:alpha-L-fucosidase